MRCCACRCSFVLGGSGVGGGQPHEVLNTMALLPASAGSAIHRLVVYDRSQADMPGEAKCR
jgi:hypothetical protein